MDPWSFFLCSNFFVLRSYFLIFHRLSARVCRSKVRNWQSFIDWMLNFVSPKLVTCQSFKIFDLCYLDNPWSFFLCSNFLLWSLLVFHSYFLIFHGLNPWVYRSRIHKSKFWLHSMDWVPMFVGLNSITFQSLECFDLCC